MEPRNTRIPTLWPRLLFFPNRLLKRIHSLVFEYLACLAVNQILFNFGPLDVSSMAQPFAFNSSRMASDFLKSLALRAAWRASSNAMISGGASASAGVPMPKTESTLSHAVNSAVASFALNELAARRLFVSVTHLNTSPQAAEMFRSSSSAAEKSEINFDAPLAPSLSPPGGERVSDTSRRSDTEAEGRERG